MKGPNDGAAWRIPQLIGVVSVAWRSHCETHGFASPPRGGFAVYRRINRGRPIPDTLGREGTSKGKMCLTSSETTSHYNRRLNPFIVKFFPARDFQLFGVRFRG